MTEDTVRIDGNALRLPGGVQVRFIRTLRLPESGTHALPPGLGEFPSGGSRTTATGCRPSGAPGAA